MSQVQINQSNHAWKITLEIAGTIGGIAAFIAIVLTPYFSLASKIDAFRAEFHEETKDFHGRLEKQDAEFKGAFVLLNERINLSKEK